MASKGKFGFGGNKKSSNHEEEILDVLNLEPPLDVTQLLKKIDEQDKIILAKDTQIKKIQQDFENQRPINVQFQKIHCKRIFDIH